MGTHCCQVATSQSFPARCQWYYLIQGQGACARMHAQTHACTVSTPATGVCMRSGSTHAEPRTTQPGYCKEGVLKPMPSPPLAPLPGTQASPPPKIKSITAGTRLLDAATSPSTHSMLPRTNRPAVLPASSLRSQQFSLEIGTQASPPRPALGQVLESGVEGHPAARSMWARVCR